MHSAWACHPICQNTDNLVMAEHLALLEMAIAVYDDPQKHDAVPDVRPVLLRHPYTRDLLRYIQGFLGFLRTYT